MVEVNLWQFLDSRVNPQPYNLIILNQPITTAHFDTLYRRASKRICADGGYDALKDWFRERRLDLSNQEPDYIIGDMDSSKKASNDGPKRVVISDQDRSDLEKCVDFVNEHSIDGHQIFLFVGAIGGRFDHEGMAISCLYKYQEHSLIMLNDKSILTLLKAGSIEIPVNERYIGPTCGLIPFGMSCKVSSSGFVWNLNDDEMEMGKLISSSNRVLPGAIELVVETDNPIVFTIEIFQV